MHRLVNFNAPRNKLGSLCTSGELIRIKKGLYIPGGSGAFPIHPFVLSGLVYGPSYISKESALASYGLIPERVNETTCMTTKRTKIFETPAGRFSYQPIHARSFSIGVKIEEVESGSYFIASPEKALCDQLAQFSSLTAQKEVPSVLEGDLRIDLDDLSTFDLELVQEIATTYRRKPITAFAGWLRKHTKS